MQQTILVIIFLTISFSGFSQYGRLHLSASMGPAFPVGKIRSVQTTNDDLTTLMGTSLNLGIDFDVSKNFGVSLYTSVEILDAEENNNSSRVHYESWYSSWAMTGAYFHHNWNKRFRIQSGMQLGLMSLQTPAKRGFRIRDNQLYFEESYEISGRNLGFGLQAKGSYYPLKFLGVFINTQLMHGTAMFSYGKQPFGSFRLEVGLETRFIK